MNTAPARLMPVTSRISGVVMAVIGVLACLAMLAPSADARPKRIVALSPFAASAMVKMGVRPIRIGQTIGGERRLDRRLRGVGVLRMSHPNGPNLELMARLKPDLVFSSPRWAKGTPALRRLGIRVVNADPTRLGQVNRTITQMGRILRRPRPANRLKRAIRNQIRAATRNISGTRPKVLLVLGIGNTAMAFLHNSWGGQVMSRAGGRLVTGGATNSGGFARLSDEVVVAQNPDVIVIVPHGTVEDIGKVYDFVKNNPAWQTTNAIENGKVYVSTQNEMLQSGTDIGRTIRIARNWLRR